MQPQRARAAGGADRQGHAHLRLHARGGARGGVRRGRAWTSCCAGPMPTPAVAYLTRALRLLGGDRHQRLAQSVRRQRHQVLLRRTADKLPDAVEHEIEARAGAPARAAGRRPSSGKARRIDDAAGPLHRVLQEHVPQRARPARPEASWSTARTARAITSRRHVFHELGADVIAIGDEPNGFNINDGVGATHPEALAAAVAGAPGRPRASRSTATATGC